MKICIACGMPMEELEDFAMGDSEKEYCKHCCKEDGSMQSYEEKLESLTKFVIKTQHLDLDKAQNIAKSMMAKLPAWNK